jgi:hypothetical protein
MPLDKSQVRKGMFLISTPRLGGYVMLQRQRDDGPLPAARLADRLAVMDRQHAAAVAEIARRLQAVRDGLDAYRKTRGK